MNKENFSLVYFLTRPLFLGLIYSFIISKSGNDALISCLLGTVLGSLFIYIINKSTLTSKFYKYTKILLYLLFICIGTFILEIFINDFFLIQTPKLMIIIPSIILCLYASLKNIDTIKYTSFIFFFFSIIIFITTAICLNNIMDTSNILPLFTSKYPSLLRSTLMFASLSSIPNVLLKDENISLKESLYAYIFTCIIMSITCFLIITSLSSKVTQIYRFPEYIMLKRIRIFNSIENVENILCSVWYVDYFFFLSLSFKNLHKEINNKIIFYILVILTVIFTTIFLAGNYYPILVLYHHLDYIFLGFITLFSFSAIKKLFISSERHK